MGSIKKSPVLSAKRFDEAFTLNYNKRENEAVEKHY